MNRTTKIVLATFALIGITILLCIIYPSLRDEAFLSQECWNKKNAKKMEFEGLVKKKFIDSLNHNTKAIELYKNNYSFLIHFPESEEYELWDKVNINDSIKKYSHSLRFYIKDNNKWYNIDVIFNCKDN